MYKGKNISFFLSFVKIFFKLKVELDLLNSRIGLGILCEQELMMRGNFIYQESDNRNN